MQVGGNLAMLQHQHRFDHAGDPGGGFQVTDIRFYRADRPGRLTSGAVDRLQRAGFHRVAHRRARTMRLDIGDILRLQPRNSQGLTDHRFLRERAGNGQPLTGAILIDRSATHQGQNRVAVAYGIRETLEQHHATAFPAHIPIGRCVEAFAAPIGGQHAGPRKRNAQVWGQDQVHARRQCHVAFPSLETDHRLVERDQRA